MLIISSGKISLGENSVTLSSGTQHNEEKLRVTDEAFTVKTPDGDREIKLPDHGLYVLNLKKDTLVGSYQRVVEGTGETRITQEILAHRVDSLKQLTAGTNVSAEKRNFFIPPGEIVKISTNLQSQVVGPFRKLPTSYEGGKEHEIYKFSTNAEIRETIEKLKPLMSDVDSTATKK